MRILQYNACSFFLGYLILWPITKPMSRLSQLTWNTNYLFKWIWLVDLNSVCIALCIFPVSVFSFHCPVAKKETKAVAADWRTLSLLSVKVWIPPIVAQRCQICELVMFLSVACHSSWSVVWGNLASVCVWVCVCILRGKHADTHKACLLVWEVRRKEERKREEWYCTALREEDRVSLRVRLT